MTEIQEAAKRLIEQHKGVQPASRATGIDAGYLVRLRDGEKRNPGPKVLKKLGLRNQLVAIK